MKFVHIITNHTQEEVDLIFTNFSSIGKELVEELYTKFKYNNFIDSNGKINMYAAIDSNSMEKLAKVYVENGVDFTYVDLTKQVLYGQLRSNGFIYDSFINEFIDNFIDRNINVDIVLEKITELGKDSLNEKDLSILKNF